MDDIMISVGNRILNKRKELRLTQTDIYEKCGIASGALSKIENGVRTPSCVILYKLACVLECSIDWLMTGKSAQKQDVEFCQKEETLLNGFRELSENDQEELIEILEMKLRKTHKTRETALEPLMRKSEGNEIGHSGAKHSVIPTPEKPMGGGTNKKNSDN